MRLSSLVSDDVTGADGNVRGLLGAENCALFDGGVFPSSVAKVGLVA